MLYLSELNLKLIILNYDSYSLGFVHKLPELILIAVNT